MVDLDFKHKKTGREAHVIVDIKDVFRTFKIL